MILTSNVVSAHPNQIRRALRDCEFPYRNWGADMDSLGRVVADMAIKQHSIPSLNGLTEPLALISSDQFN
jgi:hypothetical protein